MIPILGLLLVLCLSLLITRVAAVALTHTGMSDEMARFQARSAFSGVGFTTSEAECVVSHPVRRRIVMALMLVGNLGLAAVLASVLLSALEVGDDAFLAELALLVGGVAFLFGLARSRLVDRRLSQLISWALRRFTALEARDYAHLLHLRDDYGIAELAVAEGDWMADRALGDLGREGVVVLGVRCPGDHFIGAPGPDTRIRAGDTLIVYGRSLRIGDVDVRRAGDAGDRGHAEARDEHARVAREEHARAGR